MRVCALFAALLPLTGCIIENDGHEPRGVSLSQAMRASASGGGQPLTGHGSGETHSSVDIDADQGIPVGDTDGAVSMVDYDNQGYRWQLPVNVSYSVPLNGPIQSLTRFTITPLSVEDQHNFIGLFVGGDIVNLQPGSLPDRAVNNTWMLESGIAYRYYFTPAYTFFSPYLSANIAAQLLNWDYRNPIVVNGDTIQSDSLYGVGGYAGFGVAIKRNSYLSFFGEVGFGGTAFLNDTTQGFSNDVFSDFGYFNIKLGLSLKF